MNITYKTHTIYIIHFNDIFAQYVSYDRCGSCFANRFIMESVDRYCLSTRSVPAPNDPAVRCPSRSS